jgi:hypothetical protein
MFTFQINETTGLKFANFPAELVTISNQPLTNKNNKEYYPCSIKFVTANGEEVVRRAMMNAGNFAYGVEIGRQYRSTVTIQADGSPLITVSHLSGAESATTNDFGL